MINNEHPQFELEPTVNDLMEYSEASVARRALTRYFFTRNPEKTIQRHEKLGTPLIRQLVMGTVGRLFPRNHQGWSNYRLDKTKRPIDAAMRFAVSGSVFNEVIHTAAAAHNIAVIASDVMTSVHRLEGLASSTPGFFALNVALVALQRYNRARMLKRVNDELAAGESLGYGDRNWTGVDYRAEVAFDSSRNSG